MKIIKLNAIGSTNSYLKELSRNEALIDGTIATTNNQTLGRGQMGAKWQSKMGQSLTFSVFKRFRGLTVTDQSQIAFGVSVAVKNVLQKLQIPAISIKWPNDIMSYQQKLCGILIENQLEGNSVVSSVIGIGLNVNETEFFDLPQATSMKLVTGMTFNREELMMLISEEIQKQLEYLESGDASGLKKNYDAVLFRKNKVSSFENPQGVQFNGIIKGVTEVGELLVELDNDVVQKFELKQLKLLY